MVFKNELALHRNVFAGNGNKCKSSLLTFKMANYVWESKIVKYCIITLNWDSLHVVVMLGVVCGARYAISDCLVISVI